MLSTIYTVALPNMLFMKQTKLCKIKKKGDQTVLKYFMGI